MRLEFIPVDYDYFDFEGKNFIRLIGRTSKGERICVIDSYEPDFWVILKKEYEDKAPFVAQHIQKVEVKKAGRTTRVLKTEVHDKKFLGRKVKAIRVFVTNHKDAHDIASEIGDMKEIEFRREYDIPIITKYIKEKKVEPLKWYTLEGSLLGEKDFGGIVNSLDMKIFVRAENFSEMKTKNEFKPKILAFDIETDDTEIGKGDILMISVFGSGIKKVLTWKKCTECQNYVDFFRNEKEMIEGFIKLVKEYEPDILTGYFSDGFDLPYLKQVCVKNKIRLSLGLDGTEPVFSKGIIRSGKISGLVHLDLFRFISAVYSQYLQSETLSLNEVAGELIGENKKNFSFEKLSSMSATDWKDFFEYNLQDSKLTYLLAEKLWADIFAMSHIIKEPLFDITRDRMSSHVENYILHNLERFNEIAEKRPVYEDIHKRKALGKYEGAYVLQPVPGLYEDMCVFDFTSMHASIIVSFNLSKSTFLEREGKESYKTPEFLFDGKKSVFYFSKEKGFFSELLEEIVELRKKYKKEYIKDRSNLLKARSNAYKLLANASYGYLGFFGARYYCREAAASTLAFVRDFSKKSIQRMKDEGYNVIFSDTDSVGFQLNGKTKKHTKELLKRINSELPGIMELDLEGFYDRGLFVAKRTAKEGAKKKYALIDEKGNLKIRGFETVRRDWCRLTRNLQNDVLKSILKKGSEKEASKIFKEVVEKIKKREVDLKDLMIRTQLRRPIGEYVSEGPHVIAAKKMKEKEIPVSEGMLIEYFIGENKGRGKRVGDKVFLPDEKADYDIDYYLNNQIIPSVENIFEVFGVDVKEISQGESQKKLF
ncbi:MAG: DNA-directed DNA polymerase [Candidatus Pacearchaeota archaeon]